MVNEENIEKKYRQHDTGDRLDCFVYICSTDTPHIIPN